jgi:hypothetical protein
MNPKILLMVGLAWFGAVLLWSLFGRGSFSILLGHGKRAKLAVVALAYAFQLLIFGWILPLALAAYLFVRNH